MMTPQDFIKEEYLTLRKEIEYAVAELATTERNVVLATAAIYAWLATSGLNGAALSIAWSIPVILSTFGGLRSYTIGQHLRRLSDYIQNIEVEMMQSNEHAKGWEHFHRRESKKTRTIVTFLFWFAFLILTVVVALNGPKIAAKKLSDSPKVLNTLQR